jgi:hypothetical protein
LLFNRQYTQFCTNCLKIISGKKYITEKTYEKQIL